MTPYKREREIFKNFKQKLENDDTLRQEVEEALGILLSEYDTTVHENRFVVGGVCEHILGAAMRAAGIEAKNVGVHNPRIDLQIPSAEGFSVKGSFTGKRDAIRLINSLGESTTRSWSESTLFILSNVGVAYADPKLLRGATTSTGDALVLKRAPLDDFLRENPQYLIHCHVPAKSADIEKTKVASEAIAKEILGRIQFRILKKFVD